MTSATAPISTLEIFLTLPGMLRSRLEHLLKGPDPYPVCGAVAVIRSTTLFFSAPTVATAPISTSKISQALAQLLGSRQKHRSTAQTRALCAVPLLS